VDGAIVQAGIFDSNSQAKPGTAGCPGAGRISAPETVENVFELFFSHAHAVVSHNNGHGGVVAFQDDIYRLGFAVLDRIIHQVPQDALDTARVDVGGKVFAFGHDRHLRVGLIGQRLSGQHDVGSEVQ